MDMSSERKRQLKEEYRLLKPDMGVFAVMCRNNSKYHIEASKDLTSRTNRTVFQLNAGVHPNRELQRDWQAMGQISFDIKVLEVLKYDKDESKTDYQDDLAILRSIWAEKLTQQGFELY